MNKLFIDTCIFEAKKFNFGSDSLFVKILNKNVSDNKYVFCNLSIIDSEIKKHIAEECQNNENKILKLFDKNKWAYNFINNKQVHCNCYKKSDDYEKFKKNINAYNCDVSDINPEIIFDKYFNIKLPFEDNKKKKSEFPDAFVAEYINNLSKNKTNKIYFITCDDGLFDALDPDVKKYKSIEHFFTDINGIDPKNYEFVLDLIKNNKKDMCSNILERGSFNNVDLENETIEPESIIISDNYNLEILDENDEEIFIECIFEEVSLLGDFSCLDYDTASYDKYVCYSIDQLNSDKIDFKNYSVYLTIKKESNNYKIEYNDCYNFDISYDKMKENGYLYVGDDYYEDSWIQDDYKR